MLLLKVILLGIVEGLTEFLPVSSTGHLLLCERLLGMKDMDDPFWKMFTIFIQIGAIFAVVVYFWGRIISLLRGKGRQAADANLMDATAGAPLRPIGIKRGGKLDYETPPTHRPRPKSALALVIVGTIPVLIVGKLTHKYVEAHWEKPLPVALALLIGGLAILVVELLQTAGRVKQVEEMSYGQALWVGCCQILAAVFPGTSRSAATIMGGMAGGMSRESAAEFSFFLAIPAMFAATAYSLYKHLREHGWPPFDKVLLLIVGTLVSFLVAWVVIAAFMAYIRRRSFVPFAIYRIGLAAFVLLAVVLKWRWAVTVHVGT